MSDTTGSGAKSDDVLQLAGEIIAAYVSNNSVPLPELSGIIRSVHATLGGLSGSGASGLASGQKPAVPVKKSITPDFLICLEDGKKLKMLKRYLRTRHKLTPDEYRTKWGLPADYPMVAANYAARRSEFAKRFGLGRGQSGKGRHKKK
jgi:predicted transcriptional regulator